MNEAPVVVRGSIIGDQAEFMALLEPVLPGAYRLAVGLLQSQSDAEDALQEAVLKAWQHFGQFRRGSDPKPWLFTIVANECRRQRRARWWSVVKVPASLETKFGEPAAELETADLRRALYRLPHEQRLAVILRYYLDLSFVEIGQTLGVSSKAAKSRIYRALARLRLNPEVLTDE